MQWWKKMRSDLLWFSMDANMATMFIWREIPMTLLIHQAFENQALINPEKTAVSFYDDSLSFNELNSRANQFARYLLAKAYHLVI